MECRLKLAKKGFQAAFFIKISLMVETPPFGAVGFGFVWEGRNPFR